MIKLEYLGINQTIITLIKSYLVDITFSIKGSNTIKQYPVFGVPRCSGLGHFFYLYFRYQIPTK